MKKHLILILISAFLYMRIYPCISLNVYQLQANNIIYTEKLIAHPVSPINSNNLHKTIAIGTLGLGETVTGFTLAEVLITLTVIGVIAALTIPALLQNIQDAQLKTAWKKSFADLNEATTKLISDNGGTLLGLCNDSDHSCFVNKYLPYFSYTKSCAAGSSFGVCWNTLNNFWYYDGTPANNWADNRPMIVLNNGVFVQFTWYSSTCTDTSRIIPQCGVLQIDINGFKGPNKIGKDIFSVHVLSNGIKAYGVQGDNLHSGYCEGSTGIDSGRGCAAEYLMQ